LSPGQHWLTSAQYQPDTWQHEPKPLLSHISPFIVSHVHGPPHPSLPSPAHVPRIGFPDAHPACGVQHDPLHDPATHWQLGEHVSVSIAHGPHENEFVAPGAHGPDPMHAPATHAHDAEHVSVSVPQLPQACMRVAPGVHVAPLGHASTGPVSTGIASAGGASEGATSGD
jgi:hypothetical protein